MRTREKQIEARWLSWLRSKTVAMIERRLAAGRITAPVDRVAAERVAFLLRKGRG